MPIFFFKYFNPQMVESMYAEPTDIDGSLYFFKYPGDKIQDND